MREEEEAMDQEVFRDLAQLRSDEEVRSLLLHKVSAKTYEAEEPRFTAHFQKLNRWKKLVDRWLIVSDTSVYTLSQKRSNGKYKLQKSFALLKIKGLSRLQKQDENSASDQFIIHVEGLFDFILKFKDPNDLESALEALKYLYWKVKKLNVPVYA